MQSLNAKLLAESGDGISETARLLEIGGSGTGLDALE